MQRWIRLAIAVVVTGCAVSPDDNLDQPQDAVDDGKADTAGQSCSQVRCGNPDAANVLFPGNPACGAAGCERALAGDDLYIPPRNGAPWGDTYNLGAPDPDTLSGYSSGRIALLRRLGLIGDGHHAVLLDPSWPDGARDFTGHGPERGEDLVERWLEADPTRTFLLIYSTRSIGWSDYAALQTRAVGAQVKVCTVGCPTSWCRPRRTSTPRWSIPTRGTTARATGVPCRATDLGLQASASNRGP